MGVLVLALVAMSAVSPDEELREYVARQGTTYRLLGRSGSPNGKHVAHAWSQNPVVLSNYKTLVSVTEEGSDLLSGDRVDLFITKYRPLLEIDWQSETAISIKCVSSIVNQNAVAILPEAAENGYSITYTIIKPVEITRTFALSPAKDFAVLILQRSWDEGRANVTEILMREIINFDNIPIPTSRPRPLNADSLNADNDTLIFRVRGLHELRLDWPEPSVLEINCGNISPDQILVKEMSIGELKLNYKN